MVGASKLGGDEMKEIKPCVVCENPSIWSGCVLCGTPIPKKIGYCSEACREGDIIGLPRVEATQSKSKGVKVRNHTEIPPIG